MKHYKLIVLTLLVTLQGFAQVTTESPYSFYGLGDVNNRSFANQRAMGGAQVAAISPVYINTLNPATLGSVLYTTFAADFNLDFRTIQSASVTQNTRNSYFNNLSIAFPLGKRGGMAAGIRQFTKIGYNISVLREDEFLGEYEFVYDGQGGINEFQLGAGYNVYQDSNTTLALGANFIYYFGFAETNRRTSNFESQDALSSNIQNRTSVNDVAYDFGIYLDRRFTKDLKIGLGVSYAPQVKLNATNNSSAYTYRIVVGDESIKDSTNVSDQDGEIVMPSNLNIGVGFYLGKGWKVFADYKTQSWSQLSILGQNQNLNDRVEYAVGVESQPDGDALAKYFQSVNYRLGFRYADTRLAVNNSNVSEYAVTAGIGLPVMKTKTKSSINIGIEFGQRGSTDNNLVQENFTNLFLGVSFNPHKFDTWFKKSKYN